MVHEDTDEEFLSYNDLMDVHWGEGSIDPKSRRSKEDMIIDILTIQRFKRICKIQGVEISTFCTETGISRAHIRENKPITVPCLIKASLFLKIAPNVLLRPVLRTLSYYRKNRMIAKIPFSEIDVGDERLLK